MTPLASRTMRSRDSGSGSNFDVGTDAAAAGNRRGRNRCGIARSAFRSRVGRPGERLLDGPAAGRVVERGGERERGVARKRKHILHQTFSEARLAHDDGAVVILQRAGQESRKRWRSSHSPALPAGTSYGAAGLRRVHLLVLDAAALHAQHSLSGLEEERRGFERGLHHAARIVAQIQHQALQLRRRPASRWRPSAVSRSADRSPFTRM